MSTPHQSITATLARINKAFDQQEAKAKQELAESKALTESIKKRNLEFKLEMQRIKG